MNTVQPLAILPRIGNDTLKALGLDGEKIEVFFEGDQVVFSTILNLTQDFNEDKAKDLARDFHFPMIFIVDANNQLYSIPVNDVQNTIHHGQFREITFYEMLDAERFFVHNSKFYSGVKYLKRIG